MNVLSALRRIRTGLGRWAVVLALVLFAGGPALDHLVCDGEPAFAAAATADHASSDAGLHHEQPSPDGHGVCAHGHCHHGGAFVLASAGPSEPHDRPGRLAPQRRSDGPISSDHLYPERPPRA